MSAHTAGKIKIGETVGNLPTIEAEENSGYSIALIRPRGPVAWADARRLVACWNACIGVDTELLEDYPAAFSELRRERDQLRADLAEAKKAADFNFEQYQDAGRLLCEEGEKTERLLEALKDVQLCGHHLDDVAMRRVSEAIAAVEQAK